MKVFTLLISLALATSEGLDWRNHEQRNWVESNMNPNFFDLASATTRPPIPYNPTLITEPITTPSEAPTTIPTTTPTETPTTKPTTTPTEAPTTTTPPPPPESCTGPFSCKSCSQSEICKPYLDGGVTKWKSVATIDCPASTPFCVKSSGSCSPVPDPDCGVKDDFICTDQGRFPDTADCRKYQVCSADYTADAFDCPSGANYDADQGRCLHNMNNGGCDTFNCTGYTGVKVSLGNSHYYAYCQAGAVLTVNRCQGEYKLNTTSQVCEPICELDGLMADEDNQQMYYKCTSVVVSLNYPQIWLREHHTCPEGQLFDRSNYMCD